MPCASLWRLFQSNATFSAFSTASAPPSTKNRCGSAGSPRTRAKVSTKRAIGTLYTSELLGLFTAAAASSARNVLVVGQGRVVHAQRRRREEREHVQIALAGAGVDEMRPRRPVQVEHEIQAVGQDAAGQHGVDVTGIDRDVIRQKHSGHDTIITQYLR